MPALSTMVVFLLAALGILLIPSPAVLYIVTRSVAQGRRAGLASVGALRRQAWFIWLQQRLGFRRC